jgi:hypothetical protein
MKGSIRLAATVSKLLSNPGNPAAGQGFGCSPSLLAGPWHVLRMTVAAKRPGPAIHFPFDEIFGRVGQRRVQESFTDSYANGNSLGVRDLCRLIIYHVWTRPSRGIEACDSTAAAAQMKARSRL